MNYLSCYKIPLSLAGCSLLSVWILRNLRVAEGGGLYSWVHSQFVQGLGLIVLSLSWLCASWKCALEHIQCYVHMAGRDWWASWELCRSSFHWETFLDKLPRISTTLWNRVWKYRTTRCPSNALGFGRLFTTLQFECFLVGQEAGTFSHLGLRYQRLTLNQLIIDYMASEGMLPVLRSCQLNCSCFTAREGGCWWGSAQSCEGINAPKII